MGTLGEGWRGLEVWADLFSQKWLDWERSLREREAQAVFLALRFPVWKGPPSLSLKPPTTGGSPWPRVNVAPGSH